MRQWFTMSTLFVVNNFLGTWTTEFEWNFMSNYRLWIWNKTSCARGDTICLRPLQVDNIFYLFARWHLFRHVGYLRHQQQVDLWLFDLESGIRVTCDVGYLCANFSLPRPLCSRVGSDVRNRQTDRQTDVRRQTKTSVNASALWGRRHNNWVFSTPSY